MKLYYTKRYFFLGQRKAFNGYCLVLVQTDKQAGEIRLKASSDTLKIDEILIKIKE
ncbi:hypothetical protein [Terrimonas pollutisoli]|uniref:hypothetical protein n=1 Tax=Terrimonas pollutisoli TaxID=3034147 RepID=UPI0023EDDFD7|nr:hypothetical protein [Terrimonas sp. H1YJ31]